MFSKVDLPDCNDCRFRFDCIYSQLSPEARKDWNESRLSGKFLNKSIIYSEGTKPQGIYVVCMGRVKIYNTDLHGQQMIIWIRHPAEIFGHIALFSQKEYHCNAEAMGTATISFISQIDFEKMIAKYPRISALMIKKMAIENRIIQSKLKDTAYKPARAKIAYTLIKHISFKSKNTPTPTIYGLKRTEIAELTGLALETVVRTLSDLEKKNIIKRSTSHIKIIDYQTLLKISGQNS